MIDQLPDIMSESGVRIAAGRCVRPRCSASAAYRGLTCGEHICRRWLVETLSAPSLSYLQEMRATMPDLDEGATRWRGREAIALGLFSGALGGVAAVCAFIIGVRLGLLLP